MGAAQHITRAKQELAAGDHTAAQTHALIAIAEQGQPIEHAIDAAEAYGNAMIAGVEAGATATAEAFGQISKILGGGQFGYGVERL